MPSLKVTLIPPEGEKMERIFDSSSITVGRSSKCDLNLETESLSRKHCLIEFDEGQFYITDLSSTNGVYIEGDRIRPEVRMAFNNFLPLQISIYDCLIQEVEVTSVRNPPILNADRLTLVMNPTKKMSSRALNTPLKMLKPDDKKKDLNTYIKFGLSAAIFVAILGYALTNKEPAKSLTSELSSPQPQPDSSKVAQIHKVQNEFLSTHIYVNLFSKRHCDLRIYCENLFLVLEEGEGLAKENDDYIVFIKPSKHRDYKKYSQLNTEGTDLIGFDLFMTSRIMEDFLNGNIPQLHLITVDSSNVPRTVYRFHPSIFNFNTVNRQLINTLLENSIRHNKPEEFWDVITRYVQKLDLPQ